MANTVCVVGGGPVGLTTIKNCLEEGLDVVCYETTDHIGGLWWYRESNEEGQASVMKSTIINTSKEMSAFSDFPPPKDFPNFMHNSMMVKYFQLYAKHFDLEKRIRFKQKVIRIEHAPDYEATGKWEITVLNLETNEETKCIYDAVAICTGHHAFPQIPQFPNQDKFKGDIRHAYYYKTPKGYEDKAVAVVGIGNSAVDVAVELSQGVTNKVYLSTRKGAWIFSRVWTNGEPFDLALARRSKYIANKILPQFIANRYVETVVSSHFDHSKYGLKPSHRILEQHPTINDSLPNRILSGTITVKSDIMEFTETGVIFEGDKHETRLDALVFATGYKIKFPYLDEKYASFAHNNVSLYKYVFPPEHKHPTLGFIGLVQTIGAIFNAAESQARWFARVAKGNAKLPACSEMKLDIKNKKDAMRMRYAQSERHTIQVDWIPFMDEITELIGAKPNLLKLMITDPRLFWACLFEPCVPYQYRLHGPHPWPGARDAILSLSERVYAPLQTRKVQDTSSALQYIELFLGPFLMILAGYIFFPMF